MMLLVFAALLHITLSGRTMLPEHRANETAPVAQQLQWDGGGLALCSSGACPDPTGFEQIRPDLAPFFFHPIPINRADARLLETVDGIGPHLASEIVRVRQDGVVFHSGEDLLQVPGIGTKRARQLEPQFSFAAPR
ncbi:MAG: helix-hairpin-helix domain-containing protein [Desulfoprunum sp.]|jgi:DNA uptake protein ComE-like DNA-binding protein|uniref:ComEA family DNA-binding protein n=1 Tax=Desulfoprunum sp. TaxID=2020866 RepID=UPI002692120B